MIETFTALLFAHTLADFVFQTDWIHRNKRHIPVMALHAVIVLLTAMAALGQWMAWPVIALALAHLVIDCVKTYANLNRLAAFLGDQALHVMTLLAIAAHAPDLWQSGLWADHPVLLPVMALLTGLIVTLTAGQHAVGLLMRAHTIRLRPGGLRNGGRQIGMLERGLIFFFVLAGQPLAVGFLIAAKSILRFGTASRDQTSAEYVIIGTLASFGWAFLSAEATAALLTALPPLELTTP